VGSGADGTGRTLGAVDGDASSVGCGDRLEEDGDATADGDGSADGDVAVLHAAARTAMTIKSPGTMRDIFLLRLGFGGTAASAIWTRIPAALWPDECQQDVG
jgi:hypothetical protein